MKRSLFAAWSLCVLLFACSKENVNQDLLAPAGKKVPIHLSVADFVKKVETLPSPLGRKNSVSAKDSVLSTQVSDIYFFVFDLNGYSVDFIHQHSTDENFGIVSDSLTEGNYRIAIVASSDSLMLIGNVGFTNQPDEAMAPTPFPDVFYNFMDITVSVDGTNAYDMSLDRRVGLLEVNIADAPAISMDSAITVSLRFENNFFYPSTGATFQSAYSFPMAIPRRSRQVFNAFVINTDVDVSVDITYPDRTSDTMLTKTISSVNIDRNTKTILSGNIYSPLAEPAVISNGFSVSVNNIWAPSNEIGF